MDDTILLFALIAAIGTGGILSLLSLVVMAIEVFAEAD